MNPQNSKVGPARERLQPGDTILFLGDHTSPDDEGYVRIIRDVVTRFHPTLRPTLISAGSRGQTASSLNSQALLDLLTSAKPQRVAIGIGLADALAEPDLGRQTALYLEQVGREEQNSAIGQETGQMRHEVETPAEWQFDSKRVADFEASLSEFVARLSDAGSRVILVTTVLVGATPRYPLNWLMKQYNKAIRAVATEGDFLLVDVERAFSDVLMRAGEYKQSVVLADLRGNATAQGQALIARTFLQAIDALPHPGYRPAR